jgi:hypothetical protein
MHSPLFWLLILPLLPDQAALAAKDVPAQTCFNFKAAITAPLVPAPAENPKEPMEKTDPFDFGRKERGGAQQRYDFAQVSGYVQAPVRKIFELLTDPRTVRPDLETKITVKEMPEPHFLKQIEERIHIQPAWFLTLEWDERWAFSLLKGTKEKPETILASYEKVSGTAHLRHLCGNILIQKVSPEKSSVYLYEEVDADRREAKDVLKGLRGTLSTLRGQKPEKK